MPTSIYEFFSSIEDLPLVEVSKWLRVRLDEHLLENFIANRILYPRTQPTNLQEWQIDLALLREAVRVEPKKIYDAISNKIVLPDFFISEFGSLKPVMLAVLEVLTLGVVTTVWVSTTGRGSKQVGSVLTPKLPFKESIVTVNLNGEVYTLKTSALSLIAVPDRHLKVKLDGEAEILVAGGEFGVAFNLRRQHG